MDRRERLRRILEGLIPESALEGALQATEAIGGEIRAEEERVSPEVFGGLDAEGRGIIRVWGPIVSDGSWEALDLSYMGFPFTSPGRFGAGLAAAREAGAKDLVLRINSAGGVVAVANGMLMNLREWRNGGGSVSLAIVEAWVASAATVVMVGASRIVCGPLSEVLIHYPRVTAFGAQAQKLRDLADALDEASGEVVRLYVSTRSLEEDAVRALMAKDVPLVGQKIVDFGLADEVLEVEPPDNEPQITGRADEPAAEPPAVDPPPEPPAGEPPEEPPQIQDGADAGDGGEPSDPPSPGDGPGSDLLRSRMRRMRRLSR